MDEFNQENEHQEAHHFDEPNQDAEKSHNDQEADVDAPPAPVPNQSPAVALVDVKLFLQTQVDAYHAKRDHAVLLIEWNERMMKYFAAQRIPFIQKIIHAKQKLALSNTAMLEMKSLLEYVLDLHVFSAKQCKNVKLFGSFLEENGGFPRPPAGSATDPSVLSLGALAALIHSSHQTHTIFATKLRESIAELQELFKSYNKQRDAMISAMEASCDASEGVCKKTYSVLDDIVLALVNNRQALVGHRLLKALPERPASSNDSEDSEHSPAVIYQSLLKDVTLDDCNMSKEALAADGGIPLSNASSVLQRFTLRNRKDTFMLEQKYRENVLDIARSHRALFSQCARSLNTINLAEESRAMTMHRILSNLTVSQVQMNTSIATMAEKCFNDVKEAPAVANANLTPEEECYGQSITTTSRVPSEKGMSVFVDPAAAGRTSSNKPVADRPEKATPVPPQSPKASTAPLNDDIFEVNLLCDMDTYSRSVVESMANLAWVPSCPNAPGPLPQNLNVAEASLATYVRGLGSNVKSIICLTSDNHLLCIPLASLNQNPKMLEWAESTELSKTAGSSESLQKINLVPLKGNSISKAALCNLDLYFTSAQISPKNNLTLNLRMKAGFFDKKSVSLVFSTQDQASYWLNKINALNIHNH